MATMDPAQSPRFRSTAARRIGGARRRAVNRAVLVLAAAVSALVLFDALFHTFTGEPSPVSYNASPATTAVYDVADILLHAGFAAVLVLTGREIDAGRTSRTVLRVLLVAATTVIAGIGVAGEAAEAVTGPLPEDGALMAAGSMAFFVVMVAPQVLGITMLIQGDRSSATWVLSAAAPVFVLTLVLMALGSPLGHPGYFEATVFLGIALLGLSGGPEEAPARIGTREADRGHGG